MLTKGNDHLVFRSVERSPNWTSIQRNGNTCRSGRSTHDLDFNPFR